MSDMPRRPWWKRKRWIAAFGLWLLLAYPLSVWPLNYAVGAGVVPGAAVPVLETLYSPLEPIVHSGGVTRPGFRWFNAIGNKLYRLGKLHGASE